MVYVEDLEGVTVDIIVDIIVYITVQGSYRNLTVFFSGFSRTKLLYFPNVSSYFYTCLFKQYN